MQIIETTEITEDSRIWVYKLDAIFEKRFRGHREGINI
jgi:hypothetical protein